MDQRSVSQEGTSFILLQIGFAPLTVTYSTDVRKEIHFRDGPTLSLRKSHIFNVHIVCNNFL